MPAITAISLTDSAAALHSFTMHSQKGSNFRFSEKTGVPLGDPTLDITYREPVGTSAFYRVKVNLSVPEVLTVDGSTVIDRRNSAYIDFVIHNRSTQADRNDLLAFVKSALENATIGAVLSGPEPLY